MTGPNVPPVYVIVVTHNTKRFSQRQRAALEVQTYKSWRLIVIDNASTIEERLEEADLPPGAMLIQLSQNLGFAAGNNLAARGLDVQFIALLNPDAFPTPTWLSELVDTAQRWPQAASIGSLQLRADDPSIYDGEGDEMHVFGLPFRSSWGKWRVRATPEGPASARAARQHSIA